MIFKSIRWRLQIWYGLILVAILAGFGITAWKLEVGRQLRSIDDELQRRSATLLSALAGQTQRGPGRNGGPGRPPPGFGPERGDEGPPDGGPPDGGPPGATMRPPERFQLSAQQAVLFNGEEQNSFYYAIWARNDRQLAHSTNAPSDLSLPSRKGSTMAAQMRMIGPRREFYNFTPLGECVLAGRSIAPDLAEIRRLGWLLTGVGAVVLVLGLAGGWWLVSRAISPIADISDAALKIAGGDLSQRISSVDTDNELGRLAGVLNSTFARLESAFAQQGRFTADAAHELRTPVSVILTQTQTALNRERNSVEYKETVEACQRAAQRMRRLIESMLELARLDAGQETMKAMRFDLTQAAVECVEEVMPLAEKRGIRIECSKESVEILGDRERLSQVLINLLTNAIHYNKDSGQVRVIVRRQNDLVTATVSDTGQGMTPADLKHVFERFYRADQARTGVAGRTGLGLAISKAIVEAHNGSMGVTSEVGMGTTFTVSLPQQNQS